MSVKQTHVDMVETDPEMQPETVLQEMRRLAASPAETIQKWIFLAVLILFGVFVWYAWQSNAEQPEKLYGLLERQYTLLEKQVTGQATSMQIQQDSLKQIQDFAIRVPLEHQSHDTKLTMLTASYDRLAADNSALREAVKANTDAISRLIEILDRRMSDPNAQSPPK
jgi:hypothetical protein